MSDDNDGPCCSNPDRSSPCTNHEPSPRCRSGCKTQDHESYAECLKAAAVQIGNLK